MRASVPVGPAVGRPGEGCRSFLRPADHVVGVMGFAVLGAEGVNQGGATTPVPFPLDTGGGGWGS